MVLAGTLTKEINFLLLLSADTRDKQTEHQIWKLSLFSEIGLQTGARLPNFGEELPMQACISGSWK